MPDVVVPGVHPVQSASAMLVEYLPAAQTAQLSLLIAPDVNLPYPAEHKLQSEDASCSAAVVPSDVVVPTAHVKQSASAMPAR